MVYQTDGQEPLVEKFKNTLLFEIELLYEFLSIQDRCSIKIHSLAQTPHLSFLDLCSCMILDLINKNSYVTRFWS